MARKPSLVVVRPPWVTAATERTYVFSTGSDTVLGGFLGLHFHEHYSPNGGKPTLVITISHQDDDIVVMVDGHSVDKRED